VVGVLLATGERPLPMGGYSHQAPEPSLGALEHLVRTGGLRFLLLQRSGPRTGASINPVLDAERSWIGQRCRVVRSGGSPEPAGTTEELYDCAAPLRPGPVLR
jgi:hypothetical protein